MSHCLLEGPCSVGVAGLVSLAVLGPAGAAADAVEPPPTWCPLGTEVHVGKDGSYCEAQPPDDCPDGYVPRVYRDTPYCEPPPATACPPGSVYATWQPGEPGACLQAPTCSPGSCRSGRVCRSSGLCINPHNREDPRFADIFAHGACEDDDDCEGAYVCEIAMRCHEDPPRVDPQARELPPLIRERSCSCRAVGADRGGAGWALVGGALLGLLARRLSRSRRRHCRRGVPLRTFSRDEDTKTR